VARRRGRALHGTPCARHGQTHIVLAGSVRASPNLELVSSTYQRLLTSSVNVLIGTTEVGCRRIVLTMLTEPVPSE
jgi:hypothetical protein